MKDWQKSLKKKYRAKVEVLYIELYPTDKAIKDRISERLEAGEPKATYVKRLIREDIRREKGGE